MTKRLPETKITNVFLCLFHAEGTQPFQGQLPRPHLCLLKVSRSPHRCVVWMA